MVVWTIIHYQSKLQKFNCLLPTASSLKSYPLPSPVHARPETTSIIGRGKVCWGDIIDHERPCLFVDGFCNLGTVLDHVEHISLLRKMLLATCRVTKVSGLDTFRHINVQSSFESAFRC